MLLTDTLLVEVADTEGKARGLPAFVGLQARGDTVNGCVVIRRLRRVGQAESVALPAFASRSGREGAASSWRKSILVQEGNGRKSVPLGEGRTRGRTQTKAPCCPIRRAPEPVSEEIGPRLQRLTEARPSSRELGGR